MISRWQDWLLAIAVLAVALAGAWLLILAAESQEQPVPPLPKSIYDDTLDNLDRAAIEEAYHSYVRKQFDGWMADPRGQPQRALVGVRKARQAYIDAMMAIERR